MPVAHRGIEEMLGSIFQGGIRCLACAGAGVTPFDVQVWVKQLREVAVVGCGRDGVEWDGEQGVLRSWGVREQEMPAPAPSRSGLGERDGDGMGMGTRVVIQLRIGPGMSVTMEMGTGRGTEMMGLKLGMAL